MCECIKCKQTGRFFDKNGLDFWYFVDLFRTISRIHEYTSNETITFIIFMGETVKHSAVFKQLKYVSTHTYFISQKQKTAFILWFCRTSVRRTCSAPVHTGSFHKYHVDGLSLSASSYLKNWHRKFLASEESFKKNEFDSKNPFIARN